MTPDHVKLPARALPPVALAALAAVAACPPAVTAYPNSPIRAADFARSGRLLAGGARIFVSGPISCWKRGQVRLRATISERSTRALRGALAQGTWQGTCIGKRRRWQLTMTAADRTSFRAGCARASGLVVYGRGGETIDYKQWQTTITLADPGNANAASAC